MLHVPYSNVVRSCTRPDISQAASVISPCNLQGLQSATVFGLFFDRCSYIISSVI
jgi:hypothetical protein